MTTVPRAVAPVPDPLEMHRLHWPEFFDERLFRHVLALSRAHGIEVAAVTAILARYDLTPAEFDVLTALRRSGEPWQLTPSQIRCAMLITSGGLTKILRQLEAHRLVLRPRSGCDRRSKPVRLSARGRRLVERAAGDLVPTMGERLRKALAEPEIDQLTSLLRKLDPAG